MKCIDFLSKRTIHKNQKKRNLSKIKNETETTVKTTLQKLKPKAANLIS